ncbi:hypothetical protein H4N48_01130 [Streptomyces sp. BSE7-9]|nr:SRPBCC family protein [Streptomyces sp. BSE7-9]MBJ6642069.1 hypothetical protein [Streptomyces sp. BSE7-9]
MSAQFEVVVDVDRPIEDVFAYLADGRNDPEFSPRVLRMELPLAAGASRKDAPAFGRRIKEAVETSA